MSLRVVLLRAVNVGGATLPMARLKTLAAELGGTNISTYIASGNLLVDVPGDPGEFDRGLEQAVQAEQYETREDRWSVIGAELHLRYADGAGRPQMKIDPIRRTGRHLR